MLVVAVPADNFVALPLVVVAAETAAGVVAEIDTVAVTAAVVAVAAAAAADYTAHTPLVADPFAAADTWVQPTGSWNAVAAEVGPLPDFLHSNYYNSDSWFC